MTNTRDMRAIGDSLWLYTPYGRPWTAVWDARRMQVAYVARTENARSACALAGEAASVPDRESDVCCERPDIYALKLIITERCNLKCSYCFAKSDDVHGRCLDMTKQIVKRSLDVYADHLRHSRASRGLVSIYGGEPLLLPGIVEESIHLVRAMEAARIIDRPTDIALETNGTLIDEDIAGMLARYGVTTIVSIDGPEQLHNQRRLSVIGNGTFADAVRGYWRAKNAGAPTVISAVLGRHNIGDLPALVSFVRDSLDCVSLGVNLQHPLPDGLVADHLSDSEVATAYEELLRLGAKHGVYIEQAFRRLRPFVEERYRHRDCPSAGRRIVVRPDGRAGVCEAICLHYGEELTDIAEDVDFRMHPTFTAWYKRTPLTLGECRGCPAGGLCGGGCPYNGMLLHGDISHVDDRFCAICRAVLEWALSHLATTLKVEERLQSGLRAFRPTIKDKRILYGRAPVDSASTPLWGYTAYSERSCS